MLDCGEAVQHVRRAEPWVPAVQSHPFYMGNSKVKGRFFGTSRREIERGLAEISRFYNRAGIREGPPTDTSLTLIPHSRIAHAAAHPSSLWVLA